MQRLVPAWPFLAKRLAVAIALGSTLGFTGNTTAQVNGTLLQYFEWTTPKDGQHWVNVKNNAATWAQKGITAVWLPPAYKGFDGAGSVGYDVYDIFDLGEFNQRSSVRTGWGTRQQYLEAITAVRNAGMQTYADIVLNHKLGGETTESITGFRVDANNRLVDITGEIPLTVWTKFDFPGRSKADGTLHHNNFRWRWYHFNGADWAENRGQDGCSTDGCRVYRFKGTGKYWNSEVSTEKGNYDYLMGVNVDFAHPDVRQHLKDWGVWYKQTAQFDGFRLDATKHIQASYFDEWLSTVRSSTSSPNAFAVSEYWEPDINKLNQYVNDRNNAAGKQMAAFDVPLHYRFQQASNAGGFFDLRNLLTNTLVAWQPTRAVTFVDNHDTLDGRSLSSKVQDWFKPHAYATILTRNSGYPTVFLGDHQGVAGNVANHGWVIDQLLKVRKFHAYGVQNDYFNDGDVVGWTREGNAQHWYGVAVVLNDNQSAGKNLWMYAGNAHRNQCFVDVTNAAGGTVCTDSNGWGNFWAPAGKATVWVRQNKFGLNMN